MVDRIEASPTVVSVAPERVDAVDLAIGLPTVGDGAKLQAAVGIVQQAMTTHLAGLSAAILHVDAALPDEQVGRVDPVADGIRVMHERPAKMLSSKDGLEVWSEAVRTVLGAARTLQARVVIVLNSSMASMTPEWIRGLAQPVLKDGCAFVLPIYERGRYDGTLTQVFVAPLMRALFGRQFWYPMADEFGCSADVAEFLLAQDIWDTDLARQGLEFWLPVAVTGGAHLLTRSVLGPPLLSRRGTHPPPLSSGPHCGPLRGLALRHRRALRLFLAPRARLGAGGRPRHSPCPRPPCHEHRPRAYARRFSSGCPRPDADLGTDPVAGEPGRRPRAERVGCERLPVGRPVVGAHRLRLPACLSRPRHVSEPHRAVARTPVPRLHRLPGAGDAQRSGHRGGPGHGADGSNFRGREA